MKMKFRFAFLAVLLLTSSTLVLAKKGTGLKRNQWDYGPEITLASPLYGLALGEAVGLLYGEDRPHWAPLITNKAHIGDPSITLSNGTYNREQKAIIGRRHLNGKYKGKWYLPDFKDFSVGYGVNFMSKEWPIGFSFKLAYEYLEYDGTLTEDSEPIEQGKIIRHAIVPELLLKVRIGNYRKGEGLFCLEFGGSYDYSIGAKCLSYSGRDIMKNGINWVAGFNFADPVLHIQIGADYYFPGHHLFNSDYTPDSGLTFPLRGERSYDKVGALAFYLRLGF